MKVQMSEGETIVYFQKPDGSIFRLPCHPAAVGNYMSYYIKKGFKLLDKDPEAAEEPVEEPKKRRGQ